MSSSGNGSSGEPHDDRAKFASDKAFFYNDLATHAGETGSQTHFFEGMAKYFSEHAPHAHRHDHDKGSSGTSGGSTQTPNTSSGGSSGTTKTS